MPLFTVVPLLIAAASAPQVESEQIGPGRFRLSGEVRDANVEAAQAALMPSMRRLCGRSRPSLGSFRLREIEKKWTFEQELFCTRVPIAAPIPASASAEWKPSDADQLAVLAATYGYFAAKDRGRYDDAWARLSPSLKSHSPASHWRRSADAFADRAGAVRARRVTEISWYNNPPDARQPGLYVAADYSADFEKLEFVCGYLMWRVDPDGSFRLTREEQNVLDKATAKNLASIDRAPLRAQMGCKD